MAEENKETGPGTKSPSDDALKKAREQRDLIKETIKLQGDYNGYLADANNALNKVIKSNELLLAKVTSLNQSTLNTKQINESLNKAIETRTLLQRRQANFEADLSKSQDKNFVKFVQNQKILVDLEKEANSKKLQLAASENKLIQLQEQKGQSLKRLTDKEAQIKKDLQSMQDQYLKSGDFLLGKQIDKKKQDLAIAQQLIQNNPISILQKQVELEKKSAEKSSIKALNNKLELENQFKNLNVEQQAYIATIKALEAQQKTVDEIKKQKEAEDALKKSIGITGFLAGQFAEKLGIGEKFYSKIVEKSRESGKEITLAQKATILWKSATESVKEKYDDLKKDPAAIALAIIGGYKAVEASLTKVGKLAKSATQGISDFMSMTGDQAITKLGAGVSNLVGKLPFVGGILSGIIDGFTTLLKLSLEEDDKVTKIGRELGVSKAEATAINDRFLTLDRLSGNALITSKGLLASQKELSNELGVTNILSDEILKTNIELNKLAGLDVKTRAAIATSATITGQSAKSITQSVLGQVGALKAATGISFNYQKILSEASALGGSLGLQFAKYPDRLTKALVTTKSLGLELSKLDSMADSFLDFESSISKEFEAQLLTGKDINLAKAREAFLNNDLATAAAEITKQTGSAEGFLKMNRIQQESIASAMGMSRDSMADMLKQQELLTKLGAQDLKQAQEKVEKLKADGKTREEIVKLIGEEAYQNLTNSSAQEKIAGFIEKIQGAVANFLSKSPIVPIVESAINWLSKEENISSIMQVIQSTFATIFDIVGNVAAAIMEIANFLPGVNISEDLIEKAKGGGDLIRAMDLSTTSITPSENNGQKIKGESPATGTSGITDNMIKGVIPSNIGDSESKNLKKSGQTPIYSVKNDVKVDPLTGQGIVTTTLQTSYADASTGPFSKQTSGR